MKTIMQKTTLAAAITTTLVACGGGGGLAGIGGSGFISSGSVTGFGSIFVNGVEFETNSASFDIEGVSGSQDDLVVGMRVKVSGTVNPDGVTGTATRVEFEDQLEGPISSACTEDADLENKTCAILGVPVIFNAVDTVFVGAGASYNTLSQNDEYQISGFFDDAGNLRATAAVKKGVFVMGNQVEAKGIISNLVANTFTLSIGNTTLSIDANNADLSQAPGGLADGQFVEVKGNLTNATDTTFTATLVKLEDNNLDEGAEVEIEGIITRFADTSDFDVDGQAVNANSAVTTPANLALHSGMKVEVEGAISNGVLNASKLQLRAGEVRIQAMASNPTATSFDLTVNGQTITVVVDTSTRMDNKQATESFAQAIANLDGQFLRVRGIESDNDTVIATRVRIDTLDDTILQAVVDNQSQGASITLLGITMAVNNATVFRDINNSAYINGHLDLIGETTNGVSLIKIKDKLSAGVTDGIADEVELQRP